MYKVFIADDEPALVNSLCRLIDWESYGLELSGSASDGLETLSALDENPAQILVTDICMPHMDGLELITKAKQMLPSLKIIIISAFDNFDYVKRALLLGVENYLLKPVNTLELEETLHKTIENLDSDKLGLIHNRNSPAFRSNILDRWVNGSIQDFELYERAKLIELNLSSPEYAVCIFDMLDKVRNEAALKYPDTLLEYCKKTIMKVSRAELYIDSQLRIIAVINTDSFEHIRDDLVEVVRNIISWTKLAGIDVFASIGPVIKNSSNIKSSHMTALFFLSYRYIDPAADYYICPDNIFPEKSSSGKTDLHEKLYYALKEDPGKACQLIGEYLESEKACPVKELKQSAMTVIMLVIHAVSDTDKKNAALANTFLRQLSFYHDIKTFKELKSWLDKMIQCANMMIAESKEAYHPLIRTVLDQVNTKYADKDLSLKTLALKIKVNQAYLGQLFRTETGELFSEYLTSVRLKESKTLLAETDLKIRDIASKVGISNQSYFNQIFKKKYGMSPLEYRYQETTQQ